MSASATVRVRRRYWFEAAHRLFVRDRSDEENLELYGKCARPGGHGHNYEIEVVLAGEPDPVTGFLARPDRVDAEVEERVLSRVDHRRIDDVIDEVSTGENLARIFYDWLAPAFDGRARLNSVRVRETRNNSFEAS